MTPRNWIREGDVPRVMIPVAIFPKLALGVPAARVYAALAMRANNTSGLVDSTREQIAEDSGLSVTQVKSGIRLLVENGWITRERQGNGRTSSKYRMHAFPVASPAETQVEGGGNPTPSGSENNPPAGRESTPFTERGGRKSDRVGNPTPRGAENRPEGGGNPPPLLSIQRTCLSKDLSAVASLPDGEAPDSLFGQTLAVVHELNTSKPKSASKTNSRYSPEFEAFWKLYPARKGTKVGKFPASREWDKALKLVGQDVLMAAVKAYAAAMGPDGFPKDAERWLKHRLWEDFAPAVDGQALTFDSLRASADAPAAARLIRVPWADPFQHPDDTTPRVEWLRARRVEFIDRHRDAILAALTKAS